MKSFAELESDYTQGKEREEFFSFYGGERVH